jgi:hypothetical protein
MIGVFTLSSSKDTSSAHTARTKSIKSVLICQGDSLWSIAQAYHTEANGDFEDYVEEIRTSNGLKSHNIHAGNYILVPYYSAG